jgi:hypothetical protein
MNNFLFFAVCVAFSILLLQGSAIWKAFLKGYRGEDVPALPVAAQVEQCNQKSITLDLTDDEFRQIKEGGNFTIGFSTPTRPIDWDAQLKELETE